MFLVDSKGAEPNNPPFEDSEFKHSQRPTGEFTFRDRLLEDQNHELFNSGVTSEMTISTTWGEKFRRAKKKWSIHISFLCSLTQENFLNSVGFGNKERDPFFHSCIVSPPSYLL